MYPRKFRKIYLPELEISLYLYNFSKEVSQLTDWQTYIKFIIIWKKCINIPGMCPWKFRKASHPELKISINLLDFIKELCQLPDWQTYKKIKTILNQCTNISGMSPNNFRNISVWSFMKISGIVLCDSTKNLNVRPGCLCSYF